MYLDKALNFNLHIKEKMFKAIKGISVIQKLNKTLRHYLITICKSFMRPHLDCGDKTYDQPNNESSTLINIHFLEDVTTFYSRTDTFKYSFFPSTILEWNKSERKIRQSSTLLTFRISLLKIGRPVPKPVYNIHNKLI